MESLEFYLELQGIILSIIVLYDLILHNKYWEDGQQRLTIAVLCNAICMASDICSVWSRGTQSTYAWWIVRISNYTMIASIVVVIGSMGEYVYYRINKQKPDTKQVWIWVVRIICIMTFFFLALNPVTHCLFYFEKATFYHRAPLMNMIIFIGVLICALVSSAVVRNRQCFDKKVCLAFVSFFVFPLIGLWIQMMYVGYSFVNIGLCLSVIIVFLGQSYEVQLKSVHQEKLLLQERAYLLNSQIKPHFMFNSLNVIQALIEEDPELAQEAIGHFAKYLRKGLNLELSEGLVSIWTEVDYVENYLYMVKLRFGNKVSVEYDLDEDLDFELPFLSIQPLVEDSVHHGLRQKLGGGTITIRVLETERWNVVEVIDDGIGFDVSTLKEKTKHAESGVGLFNVKERIEIMCHGKMEIESQIGVGTTFRLMIPKK